MKIYLAGYIDGRNIISCTEWRKAVAKYYHDSNITVLDPLNGKDFSKITSDGLKSNRTPDCILTRDMMSVYQADLLIANMNRFGCERVSVGTISEVAWAIWADKPVIMITDEDQYKQHPFYSRIAAFYPDVNSLLEDGIIDYYNKGVINAVY